MIPVRFVLCPTPSHICKFSVFQKIYCLLHRTLCPLLWSWSLYLILNVSVTVQRERREGKKDEVLRWWDADGGIYLQVQWWLCKNISSDDKQNKNTKLRRKKTVQMKIKGTCSLLGYAWKLGPRHILEWNDTCMENKQTNSTPTKQEL